MSCSHCPHCRAVANPAALTLPGPPASNPRDGADVPFYREFGLAYDRARQLRLHPRQALTAANPWLSDSQCTAYLKRARALGLVQTPARRDRKQPAPAPVSPAVPRGRLPVLRLRTLTAEQCSAVLYSGEEGMEQLLDNCGRGVPITASGLRQAHSGRLTERDAADVLQWAVNTGTYQWRTPGVSIVQADG